MTQKEKVMKHYKGRVGLAEIFLLALRLLLEKYEKREYSLPCPLCSVNAGCTNCPWHVFVSGGCKYMENIVKDGHRNSRMKQIERWIKSYEEALKELRNKK